MSVLGRVSRRGSAEQARLDARLGRVHVDALNARSAPSAAQSATAAALTLAFLAFSVWRPGWSLEGVHLTLFALFTAVAVWRGATIAIARPALAPAPLRSEDLPRYTVIVPLYGEAEMAPSLLAALELIDYPSNRLQIVIALEWDDFLTRRALDRIELPSHIEIEIVPPGAPRTKPRACNAALARAIGDHVVVYDAEDRPDPGQLREAAARFAAAPADLVCLQAPLRVPLGPSLTMRQFALEYAALFEVTLPALARLGLPFPLGGTSNHFRTAALRALGGWDPWNVTEDADLGFRIAAAGLRSGVIALPTYEDAPLRFAEWLPQRSRWLKGYMQTWLVHMRRPGAGGPARLACLQATVGVTVVSAMVQAPSAVLVALGIIAATVPWGSGPGAADLLLFAGGWGMAVLAMSAGAKRAELSPRLSDALLAPAYWCLQSVAFGRAAVQLIRQPHRWDKTPHHPPETTGASTADGAPTELDS